MTRQLCEYASDAQKWWKADGVGFPELGGDEPAAEPEPVRDDWAAQPPDDWQRFPVEGGE